MSPHLSFPGLAMPHGVVSPAEVRPDGMQALGGQWAPLWCVVPRVSLRLDLAASLPCRLPVSPDRVVAFGLCDRQERA
jgi:hypothetical protein